MDDAPFELVDKEGECLTVKCTRCGAMHELPPLSEEPHHLDCSCGNEAEFILAPARPEDLKAALDAIPDRSEALHRRLRPSMN